MDTTDPLYVEVPVDKTDQAPTTSSPPKKNHTLWILVVMALLLGIWVVKEVKEYQKATQIYYPGNESSSIP